MRALVYDVDDVSTDVIWPGKYTYVQLDRAEMPRHAMEGFDPGFARRVAGRQALVVGRNFGCGSSREQASECLLASGVRLVVARSFARIFYRNCLNLGLAAVECPDAVDVVREDSEVAVDLEAGALRVDGQDFAVPPFPPFLLAILKDGGLIPHLRRRS